MQVVKVKVDENRQRYYVAKDDGTPIDIILKFLKFKDNTNYARNTLKQYAHHLKLYFEYLDQRRLEFQNIGIDDLAKFVNWLQNPYYDIKIIAINREETPRCEATINIIVNSVLTFYDYVLRHDEYSNNISEKVKKFIMTPNRNYKGFLYGIAYQNKIVASNILRLKEPKKRPKTLKKEEIENVISFCNNYRDKFIICLLYETGMRVGELLSLWLEDININEKVLKIVDRGQLENNAEIKTVTSPRKIDISQNIVDMFMEYINIYHTEEVITNHVFIKINGKNKNKAMNYVDIDNLFRMLEKKSNIHITPHMYRHTSITMLTLAGWKPEILRVRTGHKNIYTILNTYVHPSDEEVSKEFEKTKKIFTSGIEGGTENV